MTVRAVAGNRIARFRHRFHTAIRRGIHHTLWEAREIISNQLQHRERGQAAHRRGNGPRESIVLQVQLHDVTHVAESIRNRTMQIVSIQLQVANVIQSVNCVRDGATQTRAEDIQRSQVPQVADTRRKRSPHRRIRDSEYIQIWQVSDLGSDGSRQCVAQAEQLYQNNVLAEALGCIVQTELVIIITAGHTHPVALRVARRITHRCVGDVTSTAPVLGAEAGADGVDDV